MGLFKGLKDMKDMVHAAPGLIESANELSANAQVMAQQAQAQQAQYATGMGVHGAVATAPATLPAEIGEAIAGVDLRTFAQISAGIAAYDYDQAKAVVLAGERGIDAASWQLAVDGWNARISEHPPVARQFNAYYTGRA